MKSNMTINVEFLAGTTIEQAVEEAKLKAEKFDVAYICFNFNGISFSIGRNADIFEVLEEWRGSDNKYGICAA